MRAKNSSVFMYALVVAFGGFVFGMDLVLIAGTFDYTEALFGLSAAQKGFIASGPGWGALAALTFAGYICDRIGRKKSLLLIAALYMVSAVGSGLAWDFWSLFFFRLIGGLAFTSLSLASMYIGEIAPPSIRGKLVGANQLNIAIGLTAGSWLSSQIAAFGNANAEWASVFMLNDQTAWRWMLGIEAVPALLWFGFLLIIPESPRWLVLNDRHEQAKRVLAKTIPADRVEQAFGEILQNLKDTHHSLSYVQQASLLFSRKLWIALAVGLILAVVQPWTGMNAIQAFMPQIFEYAGRGATKLQDQFTINLIGMFFTLFALLMIDRIGRRIILVGGLGVCTLSLFVVTYGFGTATYSLTPEAMQAVSAHIDTATLEPIAGQVFDNEMGFKQEVEQLVGADQYAVIEGMLSQHSVSMNANLVLLGIIVFVCAFNFSAGPVLWILFSELFPTKVRALAITGCAWVTTVFGGIIVPLIYPVQVEQLGSTLTFMVYGLFCLFGMISLAKLCPETKGKSIEEIEVEIERLGRKS